MAQAPPAAGRPSPARGFHRVRVARVVCETDDARSFVLAVPEELRPAFAYRAGQFCTFRVRIDGADLLRSYSMSSAPEVDPELTVTVKRVPGGAVSNWLVDRVRPGDELETTCPAGTFQLTASHEPLVAFAAGSGITPIMSLARSALATTDRRVRLLYANRDRGATIFHDELARLEGEFGGRLELEHRWDVEHGFLDAAAVRDFVGDAVGSSELYVCGPTPFMDVVESGLLEHGADPIRIHVERFTPGGAAPPSDDEPVSSSEAVTVVVELDGRTGTAEHRAGTTILQTARQLGLDPPYSCEAGNCATCMARLVEGTVSMHVNDALTDAEVDQGWVLTCQSVPTSSTVHVVYGFD